MNADRIKRKYRRNAWYYDLGEWPFTRLRERAVDELKLWPGATVLDLGCGTGLSFHALERAIGASGRIIGVDISPDMLVRARMRANTNGWLNVELIEANAESLALTTNSVDGVLSFYTHDIMQSVEAVRRSVGALKIGCRFVSVGGKRVRGWKGLLLNPIALATAAPFITQWTGLRAPWSLLEQALGPMRIEECLLGSAYLAVGEKVMPS